MTLSSSLYMSGASIEDGELIIMTFCSPLSGVSLRYSLTIITIAFLPQMVLYIVLKEIFTECVDCQLVAMRLEFDRVFWEIVFFQCVMIVIVSRVLASDLSK